MKRILVDRFSWARAVASKARKAIGCLSTRKGVDSERHNPIFRTVGSAPSSLQTRAMGGSYGEPRPKQEAGGNRGRLRKALVDPQICSDARDRSMSSPRWQDVIVCPTLPFSLSCPHRPPQSPIIPLNLVCSSSSFLPALFSSFLASFSQCLQRRHVR